MHAGTRIVQLTSEGAAQATGGNDSTNEQWQFKVLAKFEEHQSMNYGTDVQPNTITGHRTIVSSSFYDRLICLWQFNDRPEPALLQPA